MTKLDQDTNHLRLMESDLLGVMKLLGQLEENSPHLSTFIAAGRFKLLTHATTLGGMADGLDGLDDDTRGTLQ